MINKVYDKIKIYIKENFKFLLTLIILFFVCTYELPYYIDTPGGLIDVSTRVNLKDSYKVDGTLNLAYVSEFKATLPTLLLATLNKDWDIISKSDVVASNETIEEIEYRNHLMLEEATQNATIIGFQKANEYYEVTNRKVNIAYIYEEANTDLKIGDEIIKINGNSVTSKQDVYKYIEESSTDIEFTVIHDNKEYIRKAVKIDIDGNFLVGIVLCEMKEIDTNRDVTFQFKQSESGPSGGFMMALSIYNYLIPEDITQGLKIVGTGTIDENGYVGSIGGIEYKIKASVKEKADLFFAPSANYEEAKKVVEENKLNIKLIEVSHIDDAIEYLNSL